MRKTSNASLRTWRDEFNRRSRASREAHHCVIRQRESVAGLRQHTLKIDGQTAGVGVRGAAQSGVEGEQRAPRLSVQLRAGRQNGRIGPPGDERVPGGGVALHYGGGAPKDREAEARSRALVGEIEADLDAVARRQESRWNGAASNAG